MVRHRGRSLRRLGQLVRLPLVGPDIRGRNGIAVYASDGVHVPANGRGFVVFRANVPEPSMTRDHLNPQTMD